MIRRLVAPVVLLALIAAGAHAPVAKADGDPGSDVLVYQDLFAGSDAGLSVQEQARLGGLLKAAARAGFPMRVAIIASPFDLGAVTGLWHNPRAYARFLGLELSLAYKQRLLVVMPDGFGFNWPGHSPEPEYRVVGRIPISTGGGGLGTAAQTAVRSLAPANRVKLPSATQSSPAGAAATEPGSSVTRAPTGGHTTENTVGIVALAVIAFLVIAVIGNRTLRRRRLRGLGLPGRLPSWRPARSRRCVLPGVTVLLALGAAGVTLALVEASAPSQGEALGKNPYLDPGTPLSGIAPDFALSDQFGQPVSLHSFRGKVVILAFNDSECTTLCPLTTTAMLDAKAMLGRAGSRVQLLGVDANPAAISLEDVWSYSELHGMLHAWRFLTGTLAQLNQVWRQYGIEAAVSRGQITHTPALFVIDPQGRKAKVYITQMAFTAIGQFGQLLAREASSLLPGHPPVHSDLSYSRIPPITPREPSTLPRAGGGTVQLGPGRSARLFVFFASWDQETSGLAGELDALNRYQLAAASLGLPRLTAVDEASVEPGSGPLADLLRRLSHPLSYPVAIDRSGKVADGYEVLGLPWFVLTSPRGQLLYYREVSTAGWPSTDVLIRYVREALTLAPAAPAGARTVRQQLAYSPTPLAALHSQASRVLGSQAALDLRLKALGGYPVVINAWASWCGPCQQEFPLFASASVRYGRQVAFLGADTNDSTPDARAFLVKHPVSYPSYQTTTGQLGSLAAIAGLPTTIFINRTGKVVYVHIGQYQAQGVLDYDIQHYAFGS